MHETDEDLRALQRTLDLSYERAGSHLRSIWGPETRLDAAELSAELVGVEVLDLATVTARGEPRVAPVDGLFFRGRFWFGSAESSARFRHIRGNPAVSATVNRGGESFSVIVHGRAVETDPRGPEAGGFGGYAREVYDFDWDAVLPDAPYAWIDAATLLAFERGPAASADPPGARPVVPNISSERVAETRDFFVELLGFEVAMDSGWIATVASPTNPAVQVSVIAEGQDPAAPGISVEVDDVDAVHAAAVERGVEIVYPLRDEEWGLRRFMVREPSGTIVNVLTHRRD